MEGQTKMLERAPLVSVLVPSYNHADYIEACLDSVASSEYPRIELLVLDDCSSDATHERAAKWASQNGDRLERVLVLRQQENQGVTRTLSRLVECSTGDLLVPLASDDLLLPTGIRARVDVLTSESWLLAVMGDCHVVDQSGRKLMDSGLKGLHGASVRALLSQRHLTRELLLNWSAPGPVLMLRRAALDPRLGVGPYDESSRVEDRDLYLRLLARSGMAFLPVPVAEYRLHDSNTVRQPAARANLLREVAEAERRCMPLFKGLNRLFLGLVAARGDAAANALVHGGWVRKTRYLFLRLLSRAALIGHRLGRTPMRRRKGHESAVPLAMVREVWNAAKKLIWLIINGLRSWKSAIVDRAVVVGDAALARDGMWRRAGELTEKVAISLGRGHAVPLTWLDQLEGVPQTELACAEPAVSFGPRIAGRQQVVPVATSAVTRYEFRDARVHAHSSSVLANGTLVVERPPGATAGRHNLRAGSLIAHGNSHALVRPFPVEHLSEGIFVGGNGSSNYFHWIIDFLPKLLFAADDALRRIPLLVPDELARIPTLREALDRVAGSWERVLLDPSKTYQVGRLIYISSPNAGPFNLRADHRLRVEDYAFRRSSIESIRHALGAPAPASDGQNRIFLARPGERRRYNQEEIAAICLSRGVVPVSPEQMPLQEQIGLFGNAEVVVGPSGAAWTNMLFVRPGTRCLSWLPETARDFSAYSNLAEIVGAEMRFMVYPTRAETTGQLYSAGYSLDPVAFSLALDQLLAET